MNPLALLFTAIAAATFISIGAVSIDYDKVQSFEQPKPVTISEKAAIKFKPSIAISMACHPYPAVNAAGETSSGLNGTQKGCNVSALGSQVYGRATWYKDLWAIMYAWYFPNGAYFEPPKDKEDELWTDHVVSWFFDDPKPEEVPPHKWTAAVVWLDNPAVTKPKILAVSAIGTGGVYVIKKNGPPACGYLGSSYRRRYSCDPPFVDHINDTSPMLKFIPGTDASGVELTTERGHGEFQDLIMWEQLTEEARTGLSTAGFAPPFIDEAFKPNLESARPFF